MLKETNRASKRLHYDMKILATIFILMSTPGVAQSFFHSELKNSFWIADLTFNDKTIRSKKKIELVKLRVPKDSLKESSTLWQFHEDLVITAFDAVSQTEELVLKWKYSIDETQALLFLEPPDGQRLTFSYTMISTGSFILLIRKN